MNRCMEIRRGYCLRVIGTNANGFHTAYFSKLLDIGDISRFGGVKSIAKPVSTEAKYYYPLPAVNP